MTKLTFGDRFPIHPDYDRQTRFGEERCAVCNKRLSASAEFLLIHTDESNSIIPTDADRSVRQHLIGATCIKKFSVEVVNA